MRPKPRTRRNLFRTAGGLAAGAVSFAVGGSTPVDAARDRSTTASAPNDPVTLRWLGNAGWRIDIGEHTVLVDPYLSRYPTGLVEGRLDPDTKLTVEPDEVDRYVGKPTTVLVTHSHWDHFGDVPYIARSTGARVLGTVTTTNLATACEVPSDQLVTVQGGEVLDFGAYTVEVIASLHSRNGSYQIGLPGRHQTVPAKPRTIADLPEGGTLAFQIRVADGGPAIFAMGASDFVQRNLTGLAPDIATIPLNYSDATASYTSRLLTALDQPATVVPVHWDNIERPLRNPPLRDPVSERELPRLLDEIERASPNSRVLVPEYWTPLT